MPKTTKQAFEQFQYTFLEYVRRFGLIHYDVDFALEDLPNSYAELHQDVDEAVVLVLLTNQYSKNDRRWDIEEIAKHEAVHLITARLVSLASKRYIAPGIIHEEWEAVTRRLCKLIPDEEAKCN